MPPGCSTPPPAPAPASQGSRFQTRHHRPSRRTVQERLRATRATTTKLKTGDLRDWRPVVRKMPERRDEAGPCGCVSVVLLGAALFVASLAGEGYNEYRSVRLAGGGGAAPKRPQTLADDQRGSSAQSQSSACCAQIPYTNTLLNLWHSGPAAHVPHKLLPSTCRYAMHAHRGRGL